MAGLVPTALLREVLQPLRALRARPAELQRTLARLGILAPVTADDIAALDWVADTLDAVDAVDVALRQLRRPTSGADSVAAVLVAFETIAGLLDGLSQQGDPTSFFDPEVMARIASDLPPLLLAEAVSNVPALAVPLRLAGAFEIERVGTDPNGPSWQQPARRPRLRLDALGPALIDPAGHLRGRWGWDSQIQADTLVRDLVDAARLLGLPARLDPIPSAADHLVSPDHRWTHRAAALPVVSRFVDGDRRFVEAGVVVSPTERTDGTVKGFYVGLLTDYPASAGLRLGGGWVLDASPVDAPGLVVSPDGVEVAAGASTASSLTLVNPTPRVVELPLVSASIPGLAATVTLDPSGEGLVEVRLTTATGEPIIVGIDAAGDSPFLQELVGGPIELDIDLDVAWSSDGGLRLGGGLGLTADIPIGRSIGPVRVDELSTGLTTGSNDDARLFVTVDAAVSIPPVDFVVEGLGVGVDMAFGDGLLPETTVALVPPTGIGIGIDTDVASGGGFLSLDPESGEYSAVVDLQVLGIGIGAVVLIETDSPEVDGWSVFLALFLDLPAIQLGFGFALTGVGGLAGINRGLDTEALQVAVRNGSLDAVLFPEDPVVEAPHIIDTFRSIFPAEGGRVVFGPVVQIAWGTPALVEAELGIVVSLPDPITVAVLGSIKSVLPTAELDLVALRLDLAGVIDTAAGTLSIDASLHDSHVVGFALSGDLALRADFGGRPSFLMALGGFHPRFEAPAGFPSLRRLRLAISPSPLLEVSFECYMALTSNTAQFGARFDLSAEIEGFGIEGGVSFDALIQFTPFVLSTQLGFHISIKAVGIDLAAVWLDVSLTGPNAWELDGVTRFKLLGIETELPIHETIGRGRAEPAPPPVDPRLALIAALDQPAAWAVIGTPTSSGVSLASTLASQDTVLIASPDSAITFTQRVAPLGVTLEHVGDAPIGPHHTFQLETPGAGIEPTGETRDWFAPADFFEMRPTEALQAPSFEELSAGLEFAGESSTAGTPRTGLLEYEQILRDPELAEDSTELPTQRLVDRTPETLTPLRSTAGAGITVVVDDAPALAEARWTTTDALTGAEIGRYRSWSEARAADGSDPVLTPEWEMAL